MPAVGGSTDLEALLREADWCDLEPWRVSADLVTRLASSLRDIRDQLATAEAALVQVRSNYAQSLQNSNDDIGQLHRALATAREELRVARGEKP